MTSDSKKDSKKNKTKIDQDIKVQGCEDSVGQNSSKFKIKLDNSERFNNTFEGFPKTTKAKIGLDLRAKRLLHPRRKMNKNGGEMERIQKKAEKSSKPEICGHKVNLGMNSEEKRF